MQERLLRPVDGAWLAAFRILFGVVLCVSMLRFIAYGWVDRFFVEPEFHFKYYGFGWVQPLPGPGMHLLFWGLAALAACVSAGFLFRWTAISFALGLAYVQLLDVSTYLNHYYLAALLSFLLAASPAGKGWSLDAWLFREARAEERFEVATLWLWLLRFQVGVVYTFAGLAKLNSDWLLHAQPLRIWLGSRTDLPLIGPVFTWEGVPLLMSWAGFLFDSTIVIWLSWSKTRPYAYAVVLVFHTMTRLLFPIGMFPVIMTTAALVFFSPSWPRTASAWLARPWKGRTANDGAPLTMKAGNESVPRTLAEDAPPTADPARTPSPMVRFGVAVVVAYCVVQFILPLRFLAYGGNVQWHEQGMRYSWRVMLRAKGGFARFVVQDATGSRRHFVQPDQYLTDLQVEEMVSQPDLLLQFAHHLARDYADRGWTSPRVFAKTRVSLNGRRSQPLIDPDTDLAQISDGLAPYFWVTNAPTTPPPRTRPVL